MEERRLSDASITEIYSKGTISFQDILTENHQMIRCIELAKVAAASDLTVLILGESGTGKNLLSQAIHNGSERGKAPYVSVNCSALTETLLESELFGHEKGAFTGADRMRKGRFELADGGTIFLDEIDSMSLYAQAKILRAVEYKEFERIGGERTLQSDVRVIAAANRPLLSLVKQKKFREDLYYRLNELCIIVPPLRERREDISVLAYKFLDECNRKYGKQVTGIASDALRVLTEYSWPGNIRELRAVIKRTVAVCKGSTLKKEDLILAPTFGEVDTEHEDETDLSMAAVEKRHIKKVLQIVRWNRRRAADALGMSRPTLARKMIEYGLEPPLG